MFKPERKSAEFARDRGRCPHRHPLARDRRVCAQEKLGRRVLIEHVEFELAQRRGKSRRARRDGHMPALQPRHQLADGGDRLSVIDVVENHQPGGMVVEPPERGLDLHRVLGASFSSRSRTAAARAPRIGVERRRIAGGHEQERRIIRLMPQRIFDREPRLADPAQPVQRTADERRPLVGGERRPQIVERFVAAHEQLPERGERKVAGLTRKHRRSLHQRVNHRRSNNLRDEVVGACKRRPGITIDHSQMLQVIDLRCTRRIRFRLELRAAIDTLRRRNDQQVLTVEADSEPRLPLRVGEVCEPASRATPFFASLASRPGLRASSSSRPSLLGAGVRARHLAREMNHRLALLYVFFQHPQRVAAERLEILLDLDLDVRSRQRMAQRVAIELRTRRRRKKGTA